MRSFFSPRPGIRLIGEFDYAIPGSRRSGQSYLDIFAFANYIFKSCERMKHGNVRICPLRMDVEEPSV
jgi:hypothetical protein